MRIVYNAVDSFPRDALGRNKASCAARHLPAVGEGQASRPPLAVVGGGPSVSRHVQALNAWAGEIWAINGAWKWCRDRGVRATFYSVDPTPGLIEGYGVDDAILGSVCDPSTFDACSGEIEVFPVGEHPNGSTSASTAPMIAALRGHPHVTFFGCESSFEGDQTHAYPERAGASRILVSCGGDEFLTNPQMLMQAEYLAEVARGVPGFVSTVGGGFLAALIEHGDYDVLKVSRDIAEGLAA